MKRFLGKLKRHVARLHFRRNYYLAKIIPRHVPATPLHYCPSGFTVHRIANTGIFIVDNFCTADEIRSIVGLKQGNVDVENLSDPNLLGAAVRGAMLAGMPGQPPVQFTIGATESVCDMMSGPDASGKAQQASEFPEVRVILCLGDDENSETGKLCCRELKLVVAPTAGRAIIWTNSAGNYLRWETLANKFSRSAGDSAAWLAGLSFRQADPSKPRHIIEAKQTAEGIPLVGTEALPEGTWLPSMDKPRESPRTGI